jgi:hypothetical protein
MTTVRLSYEELGRQIGRSAEGARALARRQRWRIERDNAGKAWVILDDGDLTGWRTPGDRPVTAGHERSALEEDRLLHELLERQRALLDELRAVRDGHDRLQAELLRAIERAAGAESEARTLREVLDELKAQLAEARKPWWRRWLM